MKRFCVNCGKETSSLIRGLCSECFLKKNEVLSMPKSIKVEVDKRSGRLHIGREWVEGSHENYGLIVERELLKAAKRAGIPVNDVAVTLEETQTGFSASVSFSAVIEGVEVNAVKSVELLAKPAISDASMKLSSNYHEAIIQVRFKEKASDALQREKLREVLSLLAAEKKRNELAEAVDIKHEHFGYDVYVGSAKGAKSVARKMEKKGAELTYSNKLIGVNQSGKHKFRHTFCLRF